MRTYIKWAGSKARLAKEIKENAPQTYNRLVDPFCGANHIFTILKPQNALLSDINWKLINVHQMVQSNPVSLFLYLSKLRLFYECSADKRAAYNTIRARYNYYKHDGVQMAAYFIFLNRAGYNGLYRENSKGEFNVPYGKKDTLNFDFLYDIVLKHSEMLIDATFVSSGYGEIISNVQRDDLLVLDPPYYPPISSTAHKYYGDGFSHKEQLDLERLAREAVEKGARVMAFNRDCPLARETWRGWRTIEIGVGNAINSDGAGRGTRKELMFLSY